MGLFGAAKHKKGFKSDADTFFHHFDKQRTTFPKSRQLELEKHEIIAKKRDEVVETPSSPLWSDF